MLVQAGVGQAGILIALEFKDGIVHQAGVEHIQFHQQIEVLHIQTGHFFEKSRLQLRDHILQRALPVIRQIHKDRHTGGKFDELLLNLLTHGFVFFFFLGDFLFLLLGELLALFLLGLFHALRFVDNGLNIRVQAAEALNFHQSLHGLLVRHQSPERIIVHIDQQCGFPALGQQRGRGTGHGDIQNILSVDLLHAAAVVGQYGQEVDEFRHLLFRVALIHIQAAGIIRDLLEGTVQRKVKDIALILHDLIGAGAGTHRPRRLYPERCLEIGLRAF